MFQFICILVVIIVLLWVYYKVTDAMMTDEQKNDNTPVYYKDENGEMQQTTKAEMTRQEIGKGCLWVIGAIIALVCWILSLGGC